MPRPEEGDWGNFSLAPPKERFPEADRPLVCNCDPYPCVEQTCWRSGIRGRCPACVKHGHALFTRAEIRWETTEPGQPDRGLTKAEADALRNLWGTHDGHNSRLLRETGRKYGDGAKLPEPVAEAC